MATESNDDDRLFVRDGWRHYRRKYSLREVRWGLGTFAVMALITTWVVWKGRHPDPALFDDGASLLKVAPVAAKTATGEGPAALPQVSPSSAGGSAATDRGPLPRDLAGAGWKEDKVSQFDEENLYVKINGRADYFRAFAFRRLYSVVLINEKDAATSIDIEMYDLANPPNALGAYGGERPPDARVLVGEAGLHHFSRNALFVARGPYYVRVIGSDETAVITEKLQKIAETLMAEVKGEPLPWAYGLFLGEMSFSADKITYSAKNAFSLAFADDVWAVRPKGKENDLEIFVSARKDPGAARKMADRLRGAFLELGQAAGKAGGVAMVKDQFLGLYTGTTAVDKFVVGVRGAENKAVALEQIEGLRKAITAAPPALRARAVAQPASEPAGEKSGQPAAKPGAEAEDPDER